MIEKQYVENMLAFWSKFNEDRLYEIYIVFREAVLNDKTIFFIGNGGSCAIASHMMTDFLKGSKNNSSIKPKAISLVDNASLLSAISNDINYEDVFVHQLETFSKTNDLLVSISSSGNSQNIINSILYAKDNGLKTISFTGFDGGKVKDLSEYNFHVPTKNYGIVEDIHQSMLHIISQKLRYEFRLGNISIY